MNLGLQSKVAVVTGAGKGIGLAVTMALADEGACRGGLADIALRASRAALTAMV